MVLHPISFPNSNISSPLHSFLEETSQCLKDIVLGQDPRLSLEFRPVCDDDGLYHQVQCSVHLKKCWCVDRQTGHKISDAYHSEDGFHCTPPNGKVK